MSRLNPAWIPEDFRKSLALGPDIAAVRAVMGEEGNVWTGKLRDWGLLDSTPYTIYSRPSPELMARIESERVARLEAETATLMKHHGVSSEQEALAAFRTEYDAETRKLEALEKSSLPPFLDTPPMTQDDFLDYRQVTVPGTDIPVVISLFPSMTGASINLALTLDGVPDEDLVFLSAVTLLMDSVGVIEDGVPIPAAEVVQRIRKEIRSAGISTSSNARTGRHELVASGQGTAPEETELALAWVGRFLYHSDWRTENLGRIRDVSRDGGSACQSFVRGQSQAQPR